MRSDAVKGDIPACLDDMISARRRRWEAGRGREIGWRVEADRRLVEAAVARMMAHEHLWREARQYPEKLVELCFCVVDKERRTVPFFFNQVQADFVRRVRAAGTEKPFFVLKGRQQGFTTLITAWQLAYAITNRNFSGFTMADRTDNTAAIFNDKARAVYERLPEALKPSEKFNNAREFFFDKLNSTWRAATATKQVGRSRTLNFVHFSEVAFFDCLLADLQAGVLQAVVPGGLVIYETTANGFNQARELWESGVCVNCFYEWWRSEEYRDPDLAAVARICAGDTWLTERVDFLRARGLGEDRLAWYCKKYESYLNKDTIKQEYPCTPDEAFIFSGASVFDVPSLTNQLARISGRCPGRRGMFECRVVKDQTRDRFGEVIAEDVRLEDIRFIERRDGWITLHEEPRKRYAEDGRTVTGLCPYVLGGDTAGSGDDYYTGKVVDVLTGRTAATLRVQRTDDDLYALQMLCLATYYHEAMIGIEVNFSLQPMRLIREVYGYTNIYLREAFDKLAGESTLRPGFLTTAKSKPVIISGLVADLRERPDSDPDPETVRELLTFVRKEGGVTEAVDGAHDDLVMALAIAHHLAGRCEARWGEVGRGGGAAGGSLAPASSYDAGQTLGKDYFGWEDV